MYSIKDFAIFAPNEENSRDWKVTIYYGGDGSAAVVWPPFNAFLVDLGTMDIPSTEA